MMYFILFLCGLLGIAIYSMFKISGINERTPPEVSIGSIISRYFRSDFPSIMLSVMLICAWLIFVQGYIANGTDIQPLPWVKPQYQALGLRLINFLTVGIGLFVHMSALKAFGKTEELVNKNLDQL